MFDGSTRPRREVSLGGRSRRPPSRAQSLEMTLLERRKRDKEKEEKQAIVTVNRVVRGFLVRRHLKRDFRLELQNRLALREADSARLSFDAFTRLVCLFIHGFDEKSDRNEAIQILYRFLGVLNQHLEEEYMQLLFNDCLVDELFHLVLRTLLLILEQNTSRYSSSIFSAHAAKETLSLCFKFIELICMRVGDLLKTSDGRLYSMERLFVGADGRCNRVFTTTKVCELLVREPLICGQEKTNFFLIRCAVYGLCLWAEHGVTVSVHESKHVSSFFALMMGLPLNWLEGEKILQCFFSHSISKSWWHLLRVCSPYVEFNSEMISNVFQFSLTLRANDVHQSGFIKAKKTIELFEFLSTIFSNALEAGLSELLASGLKQLLQASFIRQEYYDALAVPDVSVRSSLVLTLCNFFDLVCLKCDIVPDEELSKTSNLSPLRGLSPSAVVVSSVAFSPRQNCVVKLLWNDILCEWNVFDNRQNTIISADFFQAGKEEKVLRMLSFLFTTTCSLLRILDDEEVFGSGIPLNTDDLRSIALFAKDIVYQGLWVQKAGRITDKTWIFNSRSARWDSRLISLPKALITKSVELYNLLFDRHTRHSIMEDQLWLFDDVNEAELGLTKTKQNSFVSRGSSGFPFDQANVASVLPANSQISATGSMSLGLNLDSDIVETDDQDEDEAIQSPINAAPQAKHLLQVLPQVVRFEYRVQLMDLYLQDRRQNDGTGMIWEDFYPVVLRRGHEYDDSFLQLALHPRLSDIMKRIRIRFTNTQGLDEAGVDGGGLLKDFLMDFFQQAFNPERGLWKLTENYDLYPSPDSGFENPYHLQHFRFQGMMLGKAINEGILVEINLANFFLNSMLGNQNGIHDLQSLDKALYKNLIALKSLSDLSSLSLTFSVNRTRYNSRQKKEIVEVELVPGGSQIEVSAENFVHYIYRLSSFRLNEEFNAQAQAFFRGFSSMVPKKWIRMFKPSELQLVIGGTDGGYVVDDMRRACEYSEGYDASDQYIQAFWGVINEFDSKQRAKLLRFITGCSKPPLRGFEALNPRLTISKEVESAERLPTASTCVNLLKLPVYPDTQTLREKLLYCIHSNAGFELV